jgi:hypothetical protein
MLQILEDIDGIQRALIHIDAVKEGFCSGTILSHSFTPEQVAAFEEYEEVVNSFALSLLDSAESRIESFGFRLRGEEGDIYDLQIWEMSVISFRRRA